MSSTQSPASSPDVFDAPLTAYFLHADKGASTLISCDRNRWIVVDAYEWGSPPHNPTLTFLLSLLRTGAPPPRIRAIVVSHFHADHYAGVMSLLRALKAYAATSGFPFSALCGKLILPFRYRSYRRFFDKNQQKSGTRPSALRRFLSELETFIRRTPGINRETFISHLVPDHFALGRSDAKDPQPWVLPLSPHPPDSVHAFEAAVLRQHLKTNATRKSASARRRQTRRDENDYSYVLSVGYGHRRSDLGLLLLADFPGRRLRQLVRRLRAEIHPKLMASADAAGFESTGDLPAVMRCVARFSVDGAGASNTTWSRQLQPVAALTVPHHGSNPDRLTHTSVEDSDFVWWLDRHESSLAKPIAVVQGRRQDLGPDTLRALQRAGMRLLVSDRPSSLLHEDDKASATAARLSGVKTEFPGPKYSLETASPPSPAPEIRFLAVSGGPNGVHRIHADGSFEVDASTRRVIEYRRADIFRVRGI